MPPLQPVPQTLSCVAIWTLGSDTNVQSKQFFSYSGSAPDGADANNLAAMYIDALAGADGAWGEDVVLSGAIVTDLTSDSAARGTATGDHVGTNVGLHGPGGLCTVINYTIDRRYRGGKPRNYFPWGTATDLSSAQQWSGGYLTAVASDFSTAMSTFIGSTAGSTTVSNHVNVSYYEGFTVEGGTGGKRAKNVSTPRATPLVNSITGFSVLARPGSQRRRNV